MTSSGRSCHRPRASSPPRAGRRGRPGFLNPSCARVLEQMPAARCAYVHARDGTGVRERAGSGTDPNTGHGGLGGAWRESPDGTPERSVIAADADPIGCRRVCALRGASIPASGGADRLVGVGLRTRSQPCGRGVDASHFAPLGTGSTPVLTCSKGVRSLPAEKREKRLSAGWGRRKDTPFWGPMSSRLSHAYSVGRLG